MGRTSSLLQDDLPEDSLDPLARAALEAMGEGLYTRRLTDKLLAAFNQAYAAGELDIARLLRQALEMSVTSSDVIGGSRRPHPALTQAEQWVAFVDARSDFTALADPLSDASDAAVGRAMAQMKDAYRRWSGS